MHPALEILNHMVYYLARILLKSLPIKLLTAYENIAQATSKSTTHRSLYWKMWRTCGCWLIKAHGKTIHKYTAYFKASQNEESETF